MVTVKDGTPRKPPTTEEERNAKRRKVKDFPLPGSTSGLGRLLA